MRIEALEPCRRLLWTCRGDDPEWTGTVLTWDLVPRGGSTVVRFTHGNWKSQSEYATMCNSTWGELMYRLKDAVEAKNLGPRWLR